MKTLNVQISVVTLLLLVCFLVSCVSPRTKSQELTMEILEDLPVPDDAKLLHARKFENISKTGMGTFFGSKGLYGANAGYQAVFDEYRNLLAAQEWSEYSFGDEIRFCNPNYKDIDITITDMAGFEEYYTDILAEVDNQIIESYSTMYVVTVSHYPFDSPGFCESED